MSVAKVDHQEQPPRKLRRAYRQPKLIKGPALATVAAISMLSGLSDM